MKVLVACEESQEVCKAFRELGHEAYSCDIQECSGGHPEWHIQGDVLPLLNGDCTFVTAGGGRHTISERWDLIIAHPPCTHLAVSGAAHFERKRNDGRQAEGIELFCKFLQIDCPRVAIENPVGIISGDYIRKWFPDLAEKYGLPCEASQIIHPWQFGDNYEKTTCLWLKGLPPLKPDTVQKPELEYFNYVDKKTGKKKRQPKWFADTLSLPSEERQRIRSKTCPGIAKAMAKQWGNAPVRKQITMSDIYKAEI